MDIKENLQILGLSQNEIKIYVYLLKQGESTGSEIRRKTKTVNSQVYANLDSLLQKGVITYIKKPKGKIYSALDPEILFEVMNEKIKKIEETIPYLKELQKKEKKKTETAVFEGYNGFKAALHKLAEACPKNETIHIIGFSNQAYKNEKLAALLRDANKVSKQKKHKFKMILDDKSNSFFQQRKSEKLSEIRFMGNGFKSPASIDIFQDQVFILLWDEEPFAFTIKNQNIADGFKIYFEFLWNMAKK